MAGNVSYQVLRFISNRNLITPLMLLLQDSAPTSTPAVPRASPFSQPHRPPGQAALYQSRPTSTFAVKYMVSIIGLEHMAMSQPTAGFLQNNNSFCAVVIWA